jgi:hypothetical protein
MKKLLTVLLILIGCTVQAQPITMLSMGFGKDMISGQPLISGNFIVKNAYAGYSLSIDNTVKSYDVGWTFRVNHFYFAPTLGVTCVNGRNTKRYYLQSVTDNDITIVEIQVNVDNNTSEIIEPKLPITASENTVISVIDRIDTNNRIHPNVGIFAGYQFNDGLTLFIKGTNNSFGFGMGIIID